LQHFGEVTGLEIALGLESAGELGHFDDAAMQARPLRQHVTRLLESVERLAASRTA
jgi:hypothetical protein